MKEKNDPETINVDEAMMRAFLQVNGKKISGNIEPIFRKDIEELIRNNFNNNV